MTAQHKSPAEPGLDEQIAWLDGHCIDEYMVAATIASIKLLQASGAAGELPEPVAWTTKLALDCGSTAFAFEVCAGNLWGSKGVPLYGPEVAARCVAAEAELERTKLDVADAWLVQVEWKAKFVLAESRIKALVDGMRECRSALHLACHLPENYDMNADPDKVTLKTGRAFALADSLLVDDDAALLREVEGK